MKFCEECGAELNDDAKFCDECGCQIANEESKLKSEIKQTNNNGKKQSNLIFGLIIVIVVVLLICLYFVTNKDKDIGSTPSTSTAMTEEVVTTTEEVTTEVTTEATSSEPTTEEVTTEIITEEITTEETIVEENANTYYNELFGYSMLIPEGFEIVQEFADNDVKDGVMLSDGSAQIEIRGSDYITINTASDVMDWAYGTVTWSDLGDNYCCYSYDLNGALGYYGCYFDGNIEVYFNFQYIIDFEKDSYRAVAEQLCEYVMNGDVVK